MVGTDGANPHVTCQLPLKQKLDVWLKGGTLSHLYITWQKVTSFLYLFRCCPKYVTCPGDNKWHITPVYPAAVCVMPASDQ